MIKPTVSIVIVNFNSLHLVSDCVDSIIEFTSIPFEIIIVSNSEEAKIDVDSITEKHPTILFLSSGANLGFAKANNIGAQQANGDYLFFLNPDTVLINNAIDFLYSKIKSTPDIGIIGPSIFNSNGNQEASISGHLSLFSIISLIIPLAKFFIPPKRLGGFYILEESDFVDVIHGSSMLISSELFNKVGGMNEEFFLYYEERDLCLKVKHKNKKVYFYNHAKLCHIGGGTSKNLFIPLEIEKHRSRKIFIRTYYPSLVFLNRLSGVLGYAMRFIFSSITLNQAKIKQFSSLFKWYLLVYK